jgi:hypothetical protein
MFLGSRSVDDPAAVAGRFLCRLALMLLMIAVPCAEVVSRLAIYSLLPVGAVVLIIAGLLVGVGDGAWRFVRLFASPIGIASVLLVVWAGLSLIWTPFPAEASARFAKGLITQAVVLVAIVFLPERTRAANLYLLPIGIGLAAAATIAFALVVPTLFKTGTSADATLAQRSTMSLVMLVFPALGALSLRERWRLAAALAALVAAAALAAFIEVALIAFALGALTFAAVGTNPARVGKICAIAFSALLLLAPLLALLFSLLPQTSFTEPLRISAEIVRNEWVRLITGHGIDMAARAIDIGYLPPATPSSLLFLIWYDLGILGALSFAFVTAGAFLGIGQLSPIQAPPLLAGLVAGLTIAVCGAETTQIWWITLNGLTAIAFAVFLKGQMRRKRLAAAAFDQRAGDPRYQDSLL